MEELKLKHGSAAATGATANVAISERCGTDPMALGEDAFAEYGGNPARLEGPRRCLKALLTLLFSPPAPPPHSSSSSLRALGAKEAAVVREEERQLMATVSPLFAAVVRYISHMQLGTPPSHSVGGHSNVGNETLVLAASTHASGQGEAAHAPLTDADDAAKGSEGSASLQGSVAPFRIRNERLRGALVEWVAAQFFRVVGRPTFARRAGHMSTDEFSYGSDCKRFMPRSP